MNEPLGYVILEWNQASGQPEVSGDLQDSKEDAISTANFMQNLTHRSGRRERFTVGVVTELEDE